MILYKQLLPFLIQKIIFLKLLLGIIQCTVEVLDPITQSFSKTNNTDYKLYNYCQDSICGQIKTTDSNFLSNQQVYLDCISDHYSCTQTENDINDFEIQLEMCQGYCSTNIRSKYNNTDFINYLNCKDQCLDLIQKKKVFDSDDQEQNYPFYKYYSSCYESNCTSILVESQNQSNFKYYKTILFVCYENQALCQTARSNYNITQVKTYCYEACIDTFNESDNDPFSDPDFKSFLTCDSSCLNQTLDYQTDYYQRLDEEINGKSGSSYEDQTEIKPLFWIVLSVGAFFLICVSVVVIYFMKIHSKTSIYKYEIKYTDSDEEDGQDEEEEDEEDQNDDDQDEEDRDHDQNYDGAGYYNHGSVNRGGDYNQNENGEGSRKMKTSEQEGVGRRIQFKKRSKILQREDGINIEIKDNMSRVSQQVGNQFSDSQKKMQQDDMDVNSEYDNDRQEENDHEGDQSGQYDFTKDKSKNYSIHMNSHKNLKEQMRDSGRIGRLQSPGPSETQGRRQRKILEDKSPSPPHKMSNIIQNKQLSQIKANQTMNIQRPDNSNTLLELQNYGVSAQNFSPEKKKSKITAIIQPQHNQINLDRLFLQQQIINNPNMDQDVICDEEDQQSKVKGKEQEDLNGKGGFQGRANQNKRQTQQSAASPIRNAMGIQSNQIFSDFNFGSDQSPNSQTHQVMLQKQLNCLNQNNDQQQFNLLLNQMKKGQTQNFTDKLDKMDSHPEIMMQHDEINSPELINNQKNQLGLASSTLESIHQFQQHHKLSNASKTSQIPSSHTVDDSRFVSLTQNQNNIQDSTTQQQLLSQNRQDSLGKNSQILPIQQNESVQLPASDFDQINQQENKATGALQKYQQGLSENKTGEILNISQQLESEHSYLHIDSTPKIVKYKEEEDNNNDEEQQSQIVQNQQQIKNKNQDNQTKGRTLQRPNKGKQSDQRQTSIIQQNKNSKQD